MTSEPVGYLPTAAVVTAPPVIPICTHRIPADLAPPAGGHISLGTALCGIRARWQPVPAGVTYPDCPTCCLTDERLRRAVTAALAERDTLARRCELLEAVAAGPCDLCREDQCMSDCPHDCHQRLDAARLELMEADQAHQDLQQVYTRVVEVGVDATVAHLVPGEHDTGIATTLCRRRTVYQRLTYGVRGGTEACVACDAALQERADQVHQDAGQTISGDLARVITERDQARDQVAYLEEKLIGARGREADRAAERDAAHGKANLFHRRVAELKAERDALEARREADGRAHAAEDYALIGERDTARAALRTLADAAGPLVTGAADTSSGQTMAAEAALAVALRGAQTVLEHPGGDDPYVPIHREHLSELVGAATELYRGPFSPELRAAVDTAVCLLQPDEHTADLTPATHRPVVATGGAA